MCTVNTAFGAGNGNGVYSAYGLSSASLRHDNSELPFSGPQCMVASLTRLFSTTSTTVVRIGEPLSCAARGSILKMCASGAACALRTPITHRHKMKSHLPKPNLLET